MISDSLIDIITRGKKYLGLILLAMPNLLAGEVVDVFYDQSVPQIAFAAGDVKTMLEAKGFSVETRALTTLNGSFANKKVVLALNVDSAVISLLSNQGGGAVGNLGEQSYSMRTTNVGQASYWVIGGDRNGAMYGGLQIAENIQIQGFGGTFHHDVSPTVMRRGAKLNLPMDRRLPTYSGYFAYDSGKRAIKQVWDMDFWREWIDTQARNRNNILSIWVHNPFPALVRTPGFENATLPHIEDTDGNAYTHLTHETRVQFWNDVIDYAHSRGFLFYFYNWNISPDYASSQYPAITDSRSNATTIAYYKASIKALFATYPTLDGHGIGTGDNMVGTTSADKQANPEWSWKAYGEGVTEFAMENPNRKIFFIHRLLKTTYDYVDSAWARARNIPNLQFDISVKHCIAFTYASTNPQWTKSDLEDMEAKKQATYLTLRNDGIFYNDFGDPKFVRDFIDNLPSKNFTTGEPRLRGYYIGHDDYAPMRSVFYKDAAMNNNDITGMPMLEIERKWYMENLWARIGYDKNISDDVLKNLLANRYPQLPADTLFTAWSLASRTLPPVMDLMMGTWNLDSHMYTEMSMGVNNGQLIFRTIAEMGNTEVSKGSEAYLASISQTAAGNAGTRTSSFQLADSMEDNASNSLLLLDTMSAGGAPRAEIVLNGVRQQAHLGRYYACKIRGATYLKAGNTVQAQVEMGKAYGWWMEYINSMDAMYRPEKFRYYDLKSSGFHLFDAANLKEYTDLGGTNTLAQTATNGSIQLDQPGWVYPANTVVTVTAVPHKGYRFTGWAGALSGTNNPTTITVSGNKVITANFALDTNPSVVVTVAASDPTAAEPSDNGTFTFDRTGSTSNSLTVNFAVSGTATGSSDYQSLGNTINIPAGQTSATVPLTIIDDPVADPNETVIVNVSSNSHYAIGSPGSATITIADNEVPLGETLPWMESFTMANNSTSEDGPTSWTATPATGGYRVLNNEMAFNHVGTEGVFTTGAIDISSGPVTVSVKVRSGTGLDVGQDFLQLYKKVDGGAEVQIRAADGPQAATTWTANIAGGASLVLVIRARVSFATEYYYFDDVSVILDVSAIPTVTVSATDANAGEPADTGTFTFSRAGHTIAALPVNYTLAGSATNGMDYQNLNPSVTIPAGQASITQAVNIIDDELVEGNETVVVTLSSNAAYSIGSSASAMVAIADNDILMPGNFPWGVNFDGLTPGTTSQGPPSLWTATRSSGSFGVVGDRFAINGAGDEGVFTMGPIDIAGRNINVSLDLEGAGGLESTGEAPDYLRLYIKIDGGPETLLQEVLGAQPATTWTHGGIVGTTLQLVIRLKVSSGDDFYYLDNLSVSETGILELVRWSKPPVIAGGFMKLEWAGGGMLQTSTTLVEPWTDLPDAVSPYLHPMTNPNQFFRVRK